MCEPTTIALLATAVVGAMMTKQASDSAVVSQAEATNANTAEGYRVAQEQSRSADAKAFEQATDRDRAASRQLSLARVVAAQGGGSLAANAINITGSEAEDMSRIDAGLDNVHSSVRDTMAAGQTQNIAAMNSATTALQANKMKFFSDIAGSAISVGTKKYGQSVAQDTALNKASDYELASAQKRRAFPWATGTSGMGG